MPRSRPRVRAPLSTPQIFLPLRCCWWHTGFPFRGLGFESRQGLCYHVGMIRTADDQSFNQILMSHQGPTLVEFVTPSCPACRQIEPWLQNLLRKFPTLQVMKVDATRAPNAASYFGINMAPVLIVFKNGQPMQTIRGKPPTPHRLETLVAPYV